MMRRILFWLHLCVGIAVAAAVLIMSVTGVLLAFERQCLEFADRDARTVSVPAGATARPVGELLAAASARAGTVPSTMVVRPDPSASVEFAIGRDRTIYVDPYRAAVVGEGSTAVRSFFAVVLRWHRTLGEPPNTRGPRRAIAAASNLLFLLLVLTGLWLWMPRRWSWASVRAVLWVKTGIKGRARDFNWHHVAGFWAAVPLVLLTLTGVIISYPWANAALFRLAGSPLRAQQGGRPPQQAGVSRPQAGTLAADLDKAIAVAGTTRPGWQSMSVRVPGPADTLATVTVDTGSGGEVEKKTDVVVDTRTGQVVKAAGFADRTLGQRLRALVRFVHTGEEGGFAGQLLAALATAAACLLVWTGVALAWQRYRTFRTGRGARAVQAAVVVLALAAAIAQPAFADDGQKPGATAQAATGAAPSFKPPTFTDDTLMYVFGPDYHNPFIASPTQPDGADISRNAIEIKHIDAWKYGHNLIEVQIKKSSTVEPASGGGDGALGLYGIFRVGLGINRLAGRPVIALGPLRDIDIEAGMNVESKNTAYAPQERTLFLGPNLQFRVGQGFFNLGLHLRKEWNHNGNVGTVERYRANVNISPVWRVPFRIAGAHLSFEGFADYNTAKGKDGAGHDTKPEFITRPQLKLDLGSLVGGKARVAELGVGFEYWHNIFGKNADKVPGATQFTPVVTLTVHLPIGGSGH